MVKQRDIITLNKKEIEELIDRECKKRLGMSTKVFLQKRKHGRLPNTTAVHDIEMLLRLV